MPASFDEFKRMPQDEIRRQLREMTQEERLELAMEGAMQLRAHFDKLHEDLLDGLEDDLTTDVASAEAADDLITRIRAS